jgi:glycosyltransferase involved in cell wall biosynthesis
MKLSGYVPFYNNAPTVLAAVESLRGQTVPLDEVFAVDDGSTDNSATILEAAGVRVLRQPGNLGRGAARARAMQEATGELVLCCDATNVLPANFSEKALRWFGHVKVAAVFGRISQPTGGDAVIRWRGRHLFKMPRREVPATEAEHGACFSTYGAMARRDAVLAVGNYDTALRHTEDAELGKRLLASGWNVVRDPALEALSITNNTLSQVLERYWRWNAGTAESISWRGYLSLVSYSARTMVSRDLKDHDIPGALISLYCPHYQFWRSRWRLSRHKIQR